MTFSTRISLIAVAILALVGCSGSQPGQESGDDKMPEGGAIHLSAEIPVASEFPNAQEMAARNAITDDLDDKKLGEFIGAGGGFGAMDFSYNVKDEENARKLISDAIGKHLPDAQFTITRIK